jgi:tight adherence protein C
MATTLLYLAAGAMVTGLAFALALALSGRGEVVGVARSLALIEHAVKPQEVGRSELPATERLAKPFLNAMLAMALRLSPTGTAQRLAKLLDLAGNPGTWTVERLLAAKGAALLVLGLVGLVFGGRLTLLGFLVGSAAAAFGFFLPDILVFNAGQKRQEELRLGLADALDMLTVCVEAGQGFDAAIMQVARALIGPVGVSSPGFCRRFRSANLAVMPFPRSRNAPAPLRSRRSSPRSSRLTGSDCRSGRFCESRRTRCD